MPGTNLLWPDSLQVARVRIARPTDKLKELEHFYCKGLGLLKLGGFENHKGYDGIMIGLPGNAYHLEFTQHEEKSLCPAPSKDNLLVLYIPDQESIDKIAVRLQQMGYPEVVPENVYWKDKKAIMIEDPDGWRIVLMPTTGIN
jgi:hypothetical protein